jgi:hypothetical protein
MLLILALTLAGALIHGLPGLIAGLLIGIALNASLQKKENKK